MAQRTTESAVPSTFAPPGYVLSEPIARGGMGTVHIGFRRAAGRLPERAVAIKRMHAHLGHLENFRAMFLDEAWVTSHVRHPNVVEMIDTLEHEGELLLVMEYVHGESLARLLGAGPVPRPIACAILCDALRALQATHDACTTQGKKLGTVHRDVTPQNVLVGADGRARVIDFGIAKFESQRHGTTQGRVRGKLRYLAPEQLLGKSVTNKTDLFGVGLIAFELLAGEHPLADRSGDELLTELAAARFPSLRARAPDLPEAVTDVVQAALQRDPSRRPASAESMARVLEQAAVVATKEEVGAWMRALAQDALDERTRLLDAMRSPAVAAKRRLDKKWIALCAAVGGAVLASAAATLAFDRGRPAPPVLETPPSSVSAPAPLLPPAPPSEEPAAIAAPREALPVAPAPTVPREPRPRPNPMEKAVPTIRPSSAKPSCDPPYVLDEHHQKRYRPECLRAQ